MDCGYGFMCFPDDVVAVIGDLLDHHVDRCNLRLASKAFRAAHWNRTFHSLSAVDGETSVGLARRVTSARAMKPRLRVLQIDAIIQGLDAVVGWLSSDDGAATTVSLDALTIVLAPSASNSLATVHRVLSRLPPIHPGCNAVVHMTARAPAPPPPTPLDLLVDAAGGWRVAITVHCSAWSCELVRPLVMRRAVDRLVVVHSANDAFALPAEIDYEDAMGHLVGTFEVAIMDVPDVIREWERRLAHSLYDMQGFYSCNGWEIGFGRPQQWPSLKSVFLCVAPTATCASSIVLALEELLEGTGAQLVVDACALMDPGTVSIVRRVCSGRRRRGHASADVVLRLGQAPVDAAIVAAHSVLREPGCPRGEVIGLNCGAGHRPLYDAAREASARIASSGSRGMLADWGHLLLL